MAHNWGNSTRSSTLPRNWRTQLRPAVFRRDRGLCQIRYPECCTVTATEVDHVGNRDDHRLVNLQAACSACNARKNVLTRARPVRLSERRKPEPHPGLVTRSNHRRNVR